MAVDHLYTPFAYTLSDYVLRLDNVSQQRYKEKLTFKDGNLTFIIVDPYALLSDQWQNDMLQWPQIHFGDIYIYLINSPGGYNAENLKHYKSLSAYQYVESGKVQTVYLHIPDQPKGIVILKALVQPSQRLNEELLRPWVIVRDDGTILLAHCTCIAGLGESCSHVAALLFKVQVAVQLGYTTSAPTETTCSWNNLYTKKIESLPLNKVSFKKSKPVGEISKRKRKDVPPLRQKVDPLTANQLQRLKEIAPDSVYFTSIERSDTDTASEGDVELPPTIMEIYQRNPQMNEDYIISFFNKENCTELEQATLGQNVNPKWMPHRKGRLCSSSFGKVIKRKVPTDKFVNSILSQICLRTQAVKWGHRHEDTALNLYVYRSKEVHQEFKYRKCGIFVSPEMPFLGSSPDGVVSCSCCGDGLVEVKCPYTHRNKTPLKISEVDNNFCLDISGNLKKEHVYFFQVQGQMAIANKKYCDFVVWTPEGMHVSRIKFKEDFWQCTFLRLQDFYFCKLMPKLHTIAM